MKFRKIFALTLLISIGFSSCKSENKVTDIPKAQVPFVWENATVYFMLTDRFNNGDTKNDLNFERTKNSGKFRNFMGGDFAGITKKIEEGYFDKLGVNAFWFSPVSEQIKGGVDEGTGFTYAYHGYWIKDWTSIEPNWGTKEELKKLIKTAHKHGIRVLFDVIVNHTGPVTDQDEFYGDDWARTSPQCTYKDYKTTVVGPLVANLPDIRTDSKKEVELPKTLVEKWKKEGRYEQEMKELNQFFSDTGYPRTPRYYIIKWLVDFIKEFGIDGFRVDTVKHTEADVWADLWKEAVKAFKEWKKNHPSEVLDDNEFFMVGEVYGYNVHNARIYDYGDVKVDFFANGFKSLINFQFNWDAKEKSYEEIFSSYSTMLNGEMKGLSVLNYLSSHDDHHPFDPSREKVFETATKLLLAPGSAQIYYGDETARLLNDKEAQGDAKLRSFMNWEELAQNADRKEASIQTLLLHWQKLATFRQKHLSIGAGAHQMITQKPYVFERTYDKGKYEDKVVIGLELKKGLKELSVEKTFKEGTILTDHYSGKKVKVKKGKVQLDTPYSIVLLEK